MEEGGDGSRNLWDQTKRNLEGVVDENEEERGPKSLHSCFPETTSNKKTKKKKFSKNRTERTKRSQRTLKHLVLSSPSSSSQGDFQ